VWYFKAAVEHGWSQNVLVHHISTGLHQRQGKALTNFSRTVPPEGSDLAEQVLKDPYQFDFLTLAPAAKERELERGLLAHLRYFVIELKVGPFKPEYAGKLNFYLSAADDLLRTASDSPTLGLLLCESRGGSVVEYALRDVAKPIGVSTYRVTGLLPEPLRTEIPSIEDLKEVVDKLRPDLKGLKEQLELLRLKPAGMPTKKRSPRKRPE
jgi:predicted nuclease of restriction endonuclease-like (RecB) superfamily